MREFDKIKHTIQNSSFLYDILDTVAGPSRQNQQEKLHAWSEAASALRESLKQSGLIKKIEYRGKAFWDTFDGSKKLSFIDGGSLGVNMPTADPMAIRTSAYVVNPGDNKKENRENFSMEVKLIADLFHPKNPIFDDEYEDHGALKQAARIIAEVSTAERIILNQQNKDEYKKMDSIYLHGPLVWPAGRYSDVRSSDPDADMFPRLREGIYADLIPHTKDRKVDTYKRHFIPSYLEILKYIEKSSIPVYGIVERLTSKRAPGFFTEFLIKYAEENLNTMSKQTGDEILQVLGEYNFSDPILYDFILFAGEYIEPIRINRQLPDRGWPELWRNTIKQFPHPYSTFMKINDFSSPLRIEWMNSSDRTSRDLEFIFHDARMLANYAFPLGLFIADKLAKIPMYLSKSIQNACAADAIGIAGKIENEQAYSFARKLAYSQKGAMAGRSYYGRPSAY